MKFDGRHRVYDAVWQRFSQEIRLLLENRYVYHPFWQHQNGVPGYQDWEHKLERGRLAINHALREHDTVRILSILFDRLYVLRNQLVHGGATWNSDVNRDQVRDGASLLGCLLPIFVVNKIALDLPTVEDHMRGRNRESGNLFHGSESTKGECFRQQMDVSSRWVLADFGGHAGCGLPCRPAYVY